MHVLALILQKKKREMEPTMVLPEYTPTKQYMWRMNGWTTSTAKIINHIYSRYIA